MLEGEDYDLWAALMMAKSDAAAVASLFEGTNIAALFSERSPSLSAVQDATRRKRVRILRT